MFEFQKILFDLRLNLTDKEDFYGFSVRQLVSFLSLNSIPVFGFFEKKEFKCFDHALITVKYQQCVYLFYDLPNLLQKKADE